MYKPKLEKDIRCPLEYALDIFGGKWKSRIICALAVSGAMRYTGIRRELGDITDTMLANSLRELQEDGMLDRTQFDEIPPRVEYSLTDKGWSAIPILIKIGEWGYGAWGEGREGRCGDCPTHGMVCQPVAE